MTAGCPGYICAYAKEQQWGGITNRDRIYACNNGNMPEASAVQ